MSLSLPDIALSLGVDGRTLARAVNRGTVRAWRPSPRKVELAKGEYRYLQSHWQVLAALTRALRTEPGVGLAVLYGSVARGDDWPESDIDLLIDFRDDTASRVALERRLGAALDRRVDVARLAHVADGSPFLMLQALDEGRVLVDRDDRWVELKAARDDVVAAARSAIDMETREAGVAYTSLIEDGDVAVG